MIIDKSFVCDIIKIDLLMEVFIMEETIMSIDNAKLLGLNEVSLTTLADFRTHFMFIGENKDTGAVAFFARLSDKGLKIMYALMILDANVQSNINVIYVKLFQPTFQLSDIKCLLADYEIILDIGCNGKPKTDIIKEIKSSKTFKYINNKSAHKLIIALDNKSKTTVSLISSDVNLDDIRDFIFAESKNEIILEERKLKLFPKSETNKLIKEYMHENDLKNKCSDIYYMLLAKGYIYTNNGKERYEYRHTNSETYIAFLYTKDDDT